MCVLACSFTVQSFGRSFIQVALLGNRDAQTRLRIFAIWSDSSFFAYHLRWVYIPQTHNVLQKIQKIPSNFTWRGIIMLKYPYIKLYLSVSNIYIALSIKHTISQTRLNLSLFQNPWFYSLMNVLFSSYHVTAIPSLNHSLLDAWLKSYHSKVCRIEKISKSKRPSCSTNFGIRNSEFGIQKLGIRNSQFGIVK